MLRVGDALLLRPEQLRPNFWITEQKTGKRRLGRRGCSRKQIPQSPEPRRFEGYNDLRYGRSAAERPGPTPPEQARPDKGLTTAPASGSIMSREV